MEADKKKGELMPKTQQKLNALKQQSSIMAGDHEQYGLGETIHVKT